MVSPVDTSVKHFRSDINTSLVLNGTAGSLIGLLDACLVNGFGLQTAASVTVAGGVCSITTPTLFQANEDMVILVDGATGAWVDLNGEQKLTEIATATNTIRFATDLPDGTATGTVTVKVAPAGWVKLFSGTNKAVYKIDDPQAHSGGMCLRVDDSNAQSARVVGYESMMDVDTGAGAFPTNAMFSGGGYWYKSQATNTTAVKWSVITNNRFLILQTAPGSAVQSASEVSGIWCFGDCNPYRPTGDPFAVLLVASTNPQLQNTTHVNLFGGLGSTNGRWVARSYTGLGAAQETSLLPLMGSTNLASGNDGTFGAFPSEVSGHLLLSPRAVVHPTATNSGPLRAEIPGVQHSPQSNVGSFFPLFTKVTGEGALTGRKLLTMPIGASNSITGTLIAGVGFVDITGPWG